jgi:broad specificity phosphatase PhoE
MRLGRNMRASERNAVERAMTTFFLVRHASVDAIGRFLAGRAEGVALNDEGRAQVAQLSRTFAGTRLDVVYTSPLERARATAEALRHSCGGRIEIADELHEIDFGEWTGKSFRELDSDPRWSQFNSVRTLTRIPGGELMLEAQARVVGFLQRRAVESPDARIAVVSHSDLLRSAIAYYLGVPLDHMLRFEISPASVSVLEVHSWGARLLSLNASGSIV